MWEPCWRTRCACSPGPEPVRGPPPLCRGGGPSCVRQVANQDKVGLASLGAVAAIVLVVVVGLVIKAPLVKVPENTMKFVVGVLLTSFGMFWGVEGAGAEWPGADLALLGVIPAVFLVALIFTALLRNRPTSRSAGRPEDAEVIS